MRAIFLKLYALPKTRIKRPELLAEQEKYQLQPQRSPHQHKETADHDQAKQEDGTLDRQPGVPWFYLHRGHRYKRALSGFLVITLGFDNSNPEAQQNCDRQGRDAPAPRANRLGRMQEGGGKSSRKSNEIATTPTQGPSAVIMLSTKASKREQANTKKIKQVKKKGLEAFFGQGPRVPGPSREGTPIDVVVQQRENRSTDIKGGDNPHLPQLASLTRSTKACATKKLHAEGGGEKGKEDAQTKGRKDTKKSTRKSSDDENSCKSKRTKSDDEVSATKGEQSNSVEVDLEAMKGSLRKKGTGMTKSKGLKKMRQEDGNICGIRKQGGYLTVEA
jgi:hypothetical protein